MIKAEKLSFNLGCKKLVDQVDLEIRPGELLAVVGPNGAGKSSLLKVLTGEHEHQQGTISINNKNMRHYKRDELARTRSVVNQHTEVSFPFSLRNIIAMGRHPHRSNQDVDNQVIDEAMRMAEVREFTDRIFNTLSGGEQQRGQMARAIAQILPIGSDSKRYILLDEPISNMDLSHQHGTLNYLKKLTEQQVGVLIVIHDLNLASLYADRIAVMHKAKLKLVGTPSEIITTELLENVFRLKADISVHPKYECPMISPIIH